MKLHRGMELQYTSNLAYTYCRYTEAHGCMFEAVLMYSTKHKKLYWM